MNPISSYLLAGAAGAGGKIPNKLWIFNRGLSGATFGPNDNILETHTYTASPFTSRVNAGIGLLDVKTNTMSWTKRYVIGQTTFNQNHSTNPGKPFYLKTQDKIYVSGHYGDENSDGIIVLNSSGSSITNSARLGGAISGQRGNVFTSDASVVYQTMSDTGNFSNGNTLVYGKYTLGSGSNTVSANWKSTWTNTGSSYPYVYGNVIGSGAVYTLHITYNSDYSAVAGTGFASVNLDGTQGSRYSFTVSDTYIGSTLLIDSSDNLYVSFFRAPDSNNSSRPKGQLTSYNSGFSHRFSLQPTITGNSFNTQAKPLAIDSSGNIYALVSQWYYSGGVTDVSTRRIVKVNSSGTVLWQYTINQDINEIILHPTNPNVMIIRFASAIMTQTTAALITGTWGSYTISTSTDVSFSSVSAPYTLSSGNGGISANNMSFSSNSASASVTSTGLTNDSISITSTSSLQ